MTGEDTHNSTAGASAAASTTSENDTAISKRPRGSASSTAAVVVDVPSVTTRTISGHCCVTSNSGLLRPGGGVASVDWSAQCGLVAYAGGHVVVVVDPSTLQVVQTLEAPSPTSAVLRVAWSRAPTSKHAADRLTLASADAAGRIVIWSVKSGEIRSILREGSERPVADLRWLDGRVDNSAHLLAALHPPFSLVLWDTATGAQVWKRTYAETLQGFDLDPFNPCR